jgi:DNA invertase Pin-like site-specific DNA recombinase
VPGAGRSALSLVERGVKLPLGGTLYDPDDPMGKMFFNIVAAFAEFEAGLLRLRTKEGKAVARARGRLKGPPPEAVGPAAGRAAADAWHRRVHRR